MTNKKGRLILYVRLACLLLATLLLLPFPFWINGSGIFVQASAFVTACTILAGGTFWVGSILGLGFSVISIFRKRFFCRYVCPVGLILDTVSGIKLPVKIWWKGCPPIGRYIVLLTAAGAIAGYPLFLWMDPLAFLNNAFFVYKASDIFSVIISLSGMVILFLLALTSGNFWCACICPLGATQDLLEDIGSFGRNFRKPAGTDSQVGTTPGNLFPTTRRMFITIAAGLGLSLLAQKVGHARTRDSLLRPPGAIEEDKFTGLCLRCGNCKRACPSGIIHPDTGQAGIFGFLAPVVRYENDYCIENCNACTKACPSGALQALSLEQKHVYVIGQATVDISLCLWGISDCNTCVRSCPFDAVKIYWDEKAYESYPVVDPLKCNGCGACEVYCPTGDIKAIKVRKKTD
jgi:ferredoxin